MPGSGDRLALYFDTGGYVETVKRTAPGAGGPMGLMGRQVAGKEFLDAFLQHSSHDDLVVVAPNRANADAWKQLYEQHPASRTHPRRWQAIGLGQFLQAFFPTAPASPLYFPCPPDERFVWVRQHGGGDAYAVCGVTHTLSSQNAVDNLCNLLIAPYEPYDCLICTSRAVVRMVEAVTGTVADYLRQRHGGEPRRSIRLELVPLGVDADKFRPATGEERAAQRQALRITDDEIAVLFVGRLSFHAKAHPFPMFDGLARAVRQTGRKVHLLLSGWAANDHILKSFVDGARMLAPNLRITIVDGTKPEVRFAVWKAADLFTSLSDNIQETFGLVIIEAMACGLPVVASDWDGYRDLVADGETGFLVPTLMVEDATRTASAKLLLGERNYDYFLAECSQATAVDPAAAGQAYARLLDDAALRAQLGQAGRKRVLEQFTWARVVKLYEDIWRSQEAERRALQARRTVPPRRGPAWYPAPEVSFAGYPTRWLSGADRVVAAEGAAGRLVTLLTLTLTNYSAETRCNDPAVLRRILDAAGQSRMLADLDALFQEAGVTDGLGRATVAWLLKYGLLEAAPCS